MADSDEPPPPYEEGEEEQPALEAPPEEEDEEDEANKLLYQLELPNYDDVEKRLAEPEMNYELRQNYLKKVIKDAETRRKQVAAMKMQASNRLQRGEISAEKKQIYEESNSLQGPIIKFKMKMKQQMKSFKGKGQKGRGVVFL